MSLRALIFDVDGTLAETEELHRCAFNAAFAAAELGWHWSVDLYAVLLRTTGGKERIAAFQRDHLGVTPDPDLIVRLHGDKTARYGAALAAGGLSLRPGLGALIAEARAAGLRLAIATTTTRANVTALVEAVFAEPAEAVFDVIAAGDEVAAKKPAPDVYLLALDRLGLPPGACVAFEDSANGVRAAVAAGLRVAAAPSRYAAGEDLSGATLRLQGFDDLGGLGGLGRALAA
jgi:HAD superfamily hydrolase (TIGR01509 family)